MNPFGDTIANMLNNKKWEKVLLPLLVDWKTAQAVTGGLFVCSKDCLSEEGDAFYKGYKFVDKSRIKLAQCSHASFHV